VDESLSQLIERFALARARAAILEASLPAVVLDLVADPPAGSAPTSHLGGRALVPAGFAWPARRDRPLDFVLHVDLREASTFDGSGLLPRAGHLAFFYDLEEQPWGFDPADRDGSRVAFFEEGTALAPAASPHRQHRLGARAIRFGRGLSVPSLGSAAHERLQAHAAFTDAEADRYFELAEAVAELGRPVGARAVHQMLGHSRNVQGDMQLEAQLVSHGLYCGDETGYRDPRAAALGAGAADWLLLLQVDSDEDAGLAWGDAGTLYVWIRAEDLRTRRFDRTWTGLQCH
jgi:uncharacterized protein YwqG